MDPRDTVVGAGITSAIPPVFEAYATLKLPGTGEHDPQSWLEDPDRYDAAGLTVLGEYTPEGPWCLGYLDTGESDVVFYDVPNVLLVPTHDYAVIGIEAGPAQAKAGGGNGIAGRGAAGPHVPGGPRLVRLDVVG